MNKIKRNRIKENRLNQKYRVEKKKLLEILKEEIKNTEDEIKEVIKHNKKQKAVRNLKIFGKTCQFMAPYVFITSIALGTSFVTSRNIDKNAKQYLNIKKEIDSYGNTTLEEQFQNFENEKNTISHYTKWKECEDGFYKRNVKVYSTQNLTNDLIEKITEDNDKVSLDNILGDPIEIKVEKKNYLTNEELIQEEYLKATIYFEDKNISISTKNNDTTIISKQLIISLISAIGILSSIGINETRKHKNISYKDDIKKIKENNADISINFLINKLESKKNDYEIIENKKTCEKIKTLSKRL